MSRDKSNETASSSRGPAHQLVMFRVKSTARVASVQGAPPAGARSPPVRWANASSPLASASPPAGQSAEASREALAAAVGALIAAARLAFALFVPPSGSTSTSETLGHAKINSFEAVILVVAMVILAAVLRWGRGRGRGAKLVIVAVPVAMMVVGTVPLLISGAARGFTDADSEAQMRQLATLIMFPSVFHMAASAFACVAAVSFLVTAGMMVAAQMGPQPAGSSLYFFSQAFAGIALTTYVLLLKRRAASEVRASAV